VPKSYKREVAAISLGVLYTFIGYTLYTLADIGQTDAMVSLVGILVIPTFATVAAAFGLDSYFKQNPTLQKDEQDKKHN
jgi:choline-glycine betaine transporter